MALYVETLIRAPLTEVWRRTQDPALHQRWDARFSRIGQAGPAGHFRYATTVLGLTIAGTGVTVGERHRPDGSATSALTFGSPHPLSPIRSGSGYWRYVPTPAGVRFLTGYDYTPGWGRLADAAMRPLLGWATAWSFDRLRLWLERGITPERGLRRAIAEAGARAAVVAAAAATGTGLVLPAVAAALLIPPLPGTPAARRCLRRPPTRGRRA